MCSKYQSVQSIQLKGIKMCSFYIILLYCMLIVKNNMFDKPWEYSNAITTSQYTKWSKIVKSYKIGVIIL